MTATELTREQIKLKIESVVKASKVAKDSGFFGVEVHFWKIVCGRDFPVSMRLGLKTFVKGFEQASLTGEEEIEIAKLLESKVLGCM